MNRRLPNVGAAAVDLGFAAAAFACGLIAAPAWALALVGLGAAGAWWWLRRSSLAALEPTRRLVSTLVALAVLAAVLGAVYCLGQTLRGWA